MEWWALALIYVTWAWRLYHWWRVRRDVDRVLREALASRVSKEPS